MTGNGGRDYVCKYFMENGIGIKFNFFVHGNCDHELDHPMAFEKKNFTWEPKEMEIEVR